MYAVNEREILKQKVLSDLFFSYTIFEYDYKSLDLEIYLEFFYQIYYSIYNSSFDSDEIIIQYIGRYDKFDINALNILFLMIKNVLRKYGIRMERISETDKVCIQFTKKINKRTYYVENISELETIKKSIVA